VLSMLKSLNPFFAKRSILAIGLVASLSCIEAAPEWQALWPQAAPGAPALTVPESSGPGTRLTNISVPQFQYYPAPAGSKPAPVCVIFPGGGYGIVSMENEGFQMAEWLNARGFAAIVVKYRVTNQNNGAFAFPTPFLDARRAIRTVRAKAQEWNIDPQNIGVIGSSAGGHLASLCATRFADVFTEETKDSIDSLDCRPNFAVLIYPVIRMDLALSHHGSRANLLGKNASPEKEAQLSTDLCVSSKTPPTFLLTTFDDVVDCRNSLTFATACRANNVPVTLHMFERGGHGYGLKGKGELAVWPTLLEPWLQRMAATSAEPAAK